jgi:hypothetical protein
MPLEAPVMTTVGDELLSCMSVLQKLMTWGELY